MQINHPDGAADYNVVGGASVRNFDGKFKQSVLLTGEEDALNCYRLTYDAGTGGDQARSPRHRHAFDQIRIFISGDFEYGDVVAHTGQIGYFPESVFYGPQVINPDCEIVTLQYGGAAGNGYPSIAQRRKGAEALFAKGGTIEDGMYVTIDENGERHNQDGFEALWEVITGKKVEYANPRYSGQVYMDPENFDWRSDPGTPGVARKNLGVFTERDVRVGCVHLDKGASISLGEEPAPEILFVTSGALSYNGRVHPRLSAFGTTAEERPQTLTADETADLVYIKLPTF